MDRVELIGSIGILLNNKDGESYKYGAIEEALYDPIICEFMNDPVFAITSGHT